MIADTKTSLLWRGLMSILVIVKCGIMLLPWAFLWLDWVFHEEEGTSLVFPEGYDPFFLGLMVIHSVAYFYCTHRRRKGGPMIEMVVNLLMIAGIVQNALIAARLDLWNFFQLFFGLPIVLLVFALIRNIRSGQGTIKSGNYV